MENKNFWNTPSEDLEAYYDELERRALEALEDWEEEQSSSLFQLLGELSEYYNISKMVVFISVMWYNKL